MVGCDLHQKTLVLRYAVGRGAIGARTFGNDRSGRRAMLTWLEGVRRQRRARRILFAYEASSEGFGLYDELRAAGMECHVLAPTRIARSPKHARGKNDGRDAVQLLELLRAHVLAGNDLPTVWVPDLQTRDDRELIRMRLDVADKRVVAKNQIRSLLKRNEIRRPAGMGEGWTNPYWGWLQALASGRIEGLRAGAQMALSSLLRQMEAVEAELKTLDAQVLALSRDPRYAAGLECLRKIKGVATLSAMVFLTELGDVARFSNRRQLAAYLGLVPTSNETGERHDCKGHITRQGPSRVRKVLCQSTWSLIRTDGRFREAYDTLVAKNPKRRMIAVVAIMRRLAILMWHRACEAGPPQDLREQPPGAAA
ncbi:MAG: IS110 family transposase [Planctomycetaceae bacterium]|nr:IS110 family transposase [Planctomycetaceae bacterium]